MSPSWNFPARAEPSFEGSEPSLAGAFQFSSWNRADSMEANFSNFPILLLYHDFNQLYDLFLNLCSTKSAQFRHFQNKFIIKHNKK